MAGVKRVASLLIAAVLLSAASTHAAERVAKLPPVKSFTSARFEVVPMVVNGQPVMVGKGELASPTRAHLVLKTLAADGQREQTLEIVLYDGKTYVREDTSTQWYLETKRDVCCIPPADQSLEAAVAQFGTPAALTKIGSMPVAGVPADQYQVWFGRAAQDPRSLDHITLDFWVGQQVNYLYQLQVSFYQTDPQLGAVKGELVQRFYDLDAAGIVVSPPATAVSRSSTGARLVPTLRGSGLLRTLMAPLALPELHKLIVRQLDK